MHLHHGQRGFSAVGHMAGDHLVEDDAQRVKVAGGRQILFATALLWRHVEGRADHPAAGQVKRGGAAAYHLGDAKIGQVSVAGFVQQGVGRLDVAVEDAVGMGVIQRFAQLPQDAGGF